MLMVSIIVPVYNVESYLERCITSILNQTYKSFELILVDDGSTDKSSFICDDYAKKDNRTVVVHKKNGGLSSARNAGLDIARGGYISFVDGDDYLDNSFIEKLLNSLILSNSDIAVCGYQKVKNNQYVAHVTIEKEKMILKSNDFVELSLTKYPLGVLACNKIYKKELFDNLRYPLNKYHEDEYLFHKLIDKASKTIIIKDVLYFYEQRNTSIMHNRSYKHLKDSVEANVDRLCYYLNTNNNQLIRLSMMGLIASSFELRKLNREKAKETINKCKTQIKRVNEPALGLKKYLFSRCYLFNVDFAYFVYKLILKKRNDINN